LAAVSDIGLCWKLLLLLLDSTILAYTILLLLHLDHCRCFGRWPMLEAAAILRTSRLGVFAADSDVGLLFAADSDVGLCWKLLLLLLDSTILVFMILLLLQLDHCCWFGRWLMLEAAAVFGLLEVGLHKLLLPQLDHTIWLLKFHLGSSLHLVCVDPAAALCSRSYPSATSAAALSREFSLVFALLG
ncbi:hypothetical protein U1Q18_019873, partial [Sarracenia purpurea var. burkii]